MLRTSSGEISRWPRVVARDGADRKSGVDQGAEGVMKVLRRLEPDSPVEQRDSNRWSPVKTEGVFLTTLINQRPSPRPKPSDILASDSRILFLQRGGGCEPGFRGRISSTGGFRRRL